MDEHPDPDGDRADSQRRSPAIPLSLERNIILSTPSARAATDAGTTPAAVVPAAIFIAAGTTDGTARPVPRPSPRPRTGRRSGARRRRQPAADEPLPQPFPPPRQPGHDRPLGTAQPPGRRRGGQALQVAEHDRLPVRRRQAVDLLVQLRPALRRLPIPLVRDSMRRSSPRRRRSCSRDGERRRPGPASPRAGQSHRANSPRTRAGAPSRPAGPGRGTWPGTHPRRRAGRRGSGGRLRSTIGPCRSTRAANPASADSSRPATNRSRSCPSVRSPSTPTR